MRTHKGGGGGVLPKAYAQGGGGGGSCQKRTHKGGGVLPKAYVYCLNLGIVLSKSVQGGRGLV